MQGPTYDQSYHTPTSCSISLDINLALIVHYPLMDLVTKKSVYKAIKHEGPKIDV